MDLEESFDVPLPTYSVMARFASDCGTREEAEREVAERLTAAKEPFQDIGVERQEDSGVWLITARFVLVSVDGHTAVVGLHETLGAAGLHPDEVWLDRTLA
ncbi:MAG: hypothetical protein JWO12_956 [Frankiales bacterium]|nr:hypothetical protein [Frankiales bacterium]